MASKLYWEGFDSGINALISGNPPTSVNVPFGLLDESVNDFLDGVHEGYDWACENTFPETAHDDKDCACFCSSHEDDDDDEEELLKELSSYEDDEGTEDANDDAYDAYKIGFNDGVQTTVNILRMLLNVH